MERAGFEGHQNCAIVERTDRGPIELAGLHGRTVEGALPADSWQTDGAWETTTSRSAEHSALSNVLSRSASFLNRSGSGLRFHLKLTRMRDNGTVLQPENRARLERLTVMVEDILERHQQTLN